MPRRLVVLCVCVTLSADLSTHMQRGSFSAVADQSGLPTDAAEQFQRRRRPKWALCVALSADLPTQTQRGGFSAVADQSGHCVSRSLLTCPQTQRGGFSAVADQSTGGGE